MITIYILTSEFESSRKCDRNNLQWLRKQEKVHGIVFVSPYAENDYFKEQFILPLLDKDGYIDEKNFGVPQITLDGVSYCIEKWHKNQYKKYMIMLQANELMVGDWALDGNVYAQVTSITCDGNIETTHNEHSNIELVEPIPLTEEILEKNGWIYNDEDEKFFPQTWVGGGLMLQGAEDCGYCIVVTSDYDDEDTNNTPFIIRYVHELQHALRLRRIEKEIVI